jgi:hypothetical protein
MTVAIERTLIVLQVPWMTCDVLGEIFKNRNNSLTWHLIDILLSWDLEISLEDSVKFRLRCGIPFRVKLGGKTTFKVS